MTLFKYLPLLIVANLAFAHHSTLKLVNLVFRHGQRTPASTYPTDPHINDTFAPYGWGQLTNEGKNQQYEQGKWLRERYSHFLGSKYTNNLLEALTTDVDRTKMSTALMFAGLLPPEGDQVWNENLHWHPIPTSHQKLSEDTLLLVRGCPRFSEALNEVLNEEDVKKKIDEQQEIYKYLSEHAGVEVKDPWGVEDIYSTLKAEEEFNLTLPEWTKEVYPDKLRDITAWSFQLNVWNKELKKIKGGPLLKKILNDMNALVEGKLPEGRKLYVYAGHDSTVVNLLSALNVWEKQIPVYNILAIMELHQVEDKFGVKVFIRNSTERLYELRVPGCDDYPCPLTELTKLSADVLPDNLETTCKSTDVHYMPPTDSAP
ncbi:venom acid phosphatase Acph-1 [Rhodnius prolixus]|uniref:venom acid phosphatase Acph-1 n=1 Tax=Rhodnius prolixus TaxID=13249 RepID=UPI003D18C5E4